MLTTSDIVKRFKEVHNNDYIYDEFIYEGMHKKSCIICPIHGMFYQTPHSHLKGQGCPKCGLLSRAHKRQYNTEIFINKAKTIHNCKYEYSNVDYVNSQTYVTITCPIHGDFKQKPYLHLQGRGCPMCYNDERGIKLKKDFRQFLEDLNKLYGDKYDFTDYNYINFNTKEKVVCNVHGIFYRSPYELLNGKECPICMKDENTKLRKTLESDRFLKRAKEIHGDKYDYSKVKYVNCNTPVEIICPKHGVFRQKPTYHTSGNGCQTCASEMIKSNGENEICCFLNSLGLAFQTNVRDLTYPQELDIYIPEKKIAIEYDGLYWHNELNKDKNYHLHKTELCDSKNIRLIHIFEDEWLYQKEIVKSRLKNILGITENKIFARKCVINKVNFQDAKQFLKENHIQGNCISKYRYGLYYKNMLVSLMTFGKRRVNLGSKTENDSYELLRFCNKLNTTIVGGASKLLKCFISEIKPREIISYCDRRWSNGNLYEKLGFSKTHYSQPSYFYVIGDKRQNRFSFRKDILIKQGFDKNKSEHDIMLERKMYRIYDCGTIVYTINF